jgi:type IV pilus assembly protein PilA
MIHIDKYRTTQGFTIIELMIVIAIVAILTMVAVPAYHDYTIRARIIECIGHAAVSKTGISEFRQTLGAWPASLEEAGLNTGGDSKYCIGMDDYDASTGAFAIDVDEAAIDPILVSIEPVLTPIARPSGYIDWHCSRGATGVVELKYLPATCRGT